MKQFQRVQQPLCSNKRIELHSQSPHMGFEVPYIILQLFNPTDAQINIWTASFWRPLCGYLPTDWTIGVLQPKTLIS